HVVLEASPGAVVDYDDIKLIPAPPKQGLWNHGFEKPGAAAWSLGKGAFVTDRSAKFGQYALLLKSNSAGYNTSASQRRIPVKPGQRYRLSLWAKGAGDSSSGTVYQYFRINASWPTAKNVKQASTGWIDAWGS